MITVQGNAKIVIREVQVSSFIRLHVAVKGKVELIQSDEEKVVIESDENLQEYIEVVNSGRTLYVNCEGKWQIPDFSTLQVKIYCRQLYTIHNHCSGGELISANALMSTQPVEIKIYCDKGLTKLHVDAPSIKLVTACVGDTSLQGACDTLEIKASSEGDLNTQEMRAKNVVLKNYSEGDIKLYASETLSISNYGSGDIEYYGEGTLKDIKQFGSGAVKHGK